VRLLFVSNNLHGVGGAQRLCSTLVAELSEQGFEPSLLTLEGEGRFFEGLGARGIPAHCARSGPPGRARRARRVMAFAAARRPDVVLTRGARPQAVGHAIARAFGAAHVATEHRGPGYPKERGSELLERAVAPHVHRVFAVSARQVGELLERRYRPGGIRMIRNGVQEDFWRSARPRAEARSRLGVERGHFLALMVAVLRPEKRAEAFVRSVIRASRQNPSVRGVVAGPGSGLARVSELARESGGGVRALGEREDVADLMSAANAVCLSSTAEAAPMTLLEGMSLARPVVATDVGGISEIVSHGRTGLLVPTGDEAAFAGALVTLAADPARAESLGRAGRERQRQLFTAERMSLEYASALRETRAEFNPRALSPALYRLSKSEEDGAVAHASDESSQPEPGDPHPGPAAP
jgi:glycosyltransferase involved in cell wall biosynthesis